MHQIKKKLGVVPQTLMGSLQLSPNSLAGEEGARCPLPRTPSTLLAIQALHSAISIHILLDGTTHGRWSFQNSKNNKNALAVFLLL